MRDHVVQPQKSLRSVESPLVWQHCYALLPLATPVPRCSECLRHVRVMCVLSVHMVWIPAMGAAGQMCTGRDAIVTRRGPLTERAFD